MGLLVNKEYRIKNAVVPGLRSGDAFLIEMIRQPRSVIDRTLLVRDHGRALPFPDPSQVRASLVLDALLGLQGVVLGLDGLVTLGHGIKLRLKALFGTHRLVIVAPNGVEHDEGKDDDASDDGKHAP